MVKVDKKSRSVRLFVSKLVRNGKKGKSEEVFFEILRKFKQTGSGKRPVDTVVNGLENAGPKVALLSKKVGGARYQIPVPVKSGKEESVGLRWLVDSARSGGEGTFGKRLSRELKIAERNDGDAVRKKTALYRSAMGNIAFLKFLE